MKKGVLLTLSALLLGSLVGCGKPTPPETGDDNNDINQEIVPNNPHAEIKYEDKLASRAKDGAILHAFSWSFNQIKENLPAIKEAGYTAVQTSPVQQPKSSGAKWEFLYQPVSFSIAVDSPIGNKEELEALCTEADKYGIKIICDIVFNHLAGTGKTDAKGLPIVAPEVETYEKEIYDNRNQTFHQIVNGNVTQGYPGLPDINTSNELVQQRASSLLKECIDAGVDGFRFDAAKHIETPSDGATASSFWTKTLGEAKTYYKTKTNEDLYAYGEILNETGDSRPITNYSNMMNVTANGYGNYVYRGLALSRPAEMVDMDYGKEGLTGKDLVIWAESHDSYCNDGGETFGIKDYRMMQIWSLVGSRKDATPLFFARPDISKVGHVNSYVWQDEKVASINRFHNRFIGANEDIHVGSDYAVVNERYSDDDFGAVILNTKKSQKTQIINLKHMPDGYYYDAITGTKIPVASGKAKVTFGDAGFLVLTLTKPTVRPEIVCDTVSKMYANSLSFPVSVKNATRGTYQINDAAPVEFTNSTTITLGNEYEVGQTIKVVIKAINGDHEMVRTLEFGKITMEEGYMNILNFNQNYFDTNEVYIWYWDDSGNKGWSNEITRKTDRILFKTQGTGYTGCLIAIFPQGHTIEKLHEWDEAAIKQTGNMNVAEGYFDATGF